MVNGSACTVFQEVFAFQDSTSVHNGRDMSGDAEVEAEAAAKARQQTAAIDAYPSDASIPSLPESPDGYTDNAFMHTISDIAELRLHDAFESAPSLSLDDLDDYQQVK